MNSSPLILGTAQLGMPYGIANKAGQPDQDTATAIIKEAWDNGIREFDTAQAYGDSEEILGRALSDLGLSDKARIISKFHPDLDHLDHKIMSEALSGSLKRLGVQHLFCMMFHREEMLSLWDKGVSDMLDVFLREGRIKNVGISVYSPDKAIEALNTDGISMVQLPANLLDRRFERAGVFQLAIEKKKKVYIRSVFLQGLILMDPDDIPERMLFARPILEQLESLSRDLGMTKQELALGYLKIELPNASVIIGAETKEQVRGNALVWAGETSVDIGSKVKSIFNNVKDEILNPTLWGAAT